MPAPDLSGVTVVCNGAFNPAIFHPSWLAKKELIPPNLAEYAVTKAGGQELVVSSQIAAYVADWLTVQVTQQQAVFATVDAARARDLRDLVAGVLKVLPESPVRALGVNLDTHFRAPNEETWHKFGDQFLPKDFWEPLFAEGDWLKRPDGKRVGMRVMNVEVTRSPDQPGHIRVELAPSTRLGPNGIYIGINGHFQIGSGQTAGTALDAANVLEANWDSTSAFQQQIVNALIGSI